MCGGYQFSLYQLKMMLQCIITFKKKKKNIFDKPNECDLAFTNEYIALVHKKLWFHCVWGVFVFKFLIEFLNLFIGQKKKNEFPPLICYSACRFLYFLQKKNLGSRTFRILAHCFLFNIVVWLTLLYLIFDNLSILLK